MKLHVMILLALTVSLGLHASLVDASARIFNDSSLSDAEAHTRVSGLSDFALEAPHGETLTFTHAINDTLEAPFFVVVPKGYSNDRDWPVLVWLHGGVGMADFFSRDAQWLEKGDHYMLVADSLDQYIHLYPMARYDCTWWDESGRNNILWQIRFLKDRFRVDDNRVYVSGLSDGGSGSFNLGVACPSDFAAIMPHIGMVSVSSYVTQIPVYPVNLRNRPLRVVNNEFDGLYPASEVTKHISALRRAGVRINYASYGFGHDMKYWPDDYIAQNHFMDTRKRDPFQPALTWECDYRGVGSGVDWLVVAGIDTTLAAQPWHVDVQDSLYDHRVSFGFYPDEAYEGEGILVDSLLAEDCAAHEAGLAPGDIIVGMNGSEIVQMADMDRLKKSCERGDDFTLTVLRDDERLVLEAAFPPPIAFEAFFYDENKSARVNAAYADNRIDLDTSRATNVTLKLHPAMIDFDKPVEVWANGVQVWRGRVSYDRRYMQRTFEENLDRVALWAGEINVEIPPEYR